MYVRFCKTNIWWHVQDDFLTLEAFYLIEYHQGAGTCYLDLQNVKLSKVSNKVSIDICQPPQALQPIQSHLAQAIYKSWRYNLGKLSFNLSLYISSCVLYPERNNYIFSYLILMLPEGSWICMTFTPTFTATSAHQCTHLVSAICHVNTGVQMLLLGKS